MLNRRNFLGGAVASCATLSTMAGWMTSGRLTPGTNYQVGCYTRPWAKYDYRVALDAIATAGFKYAGLMTTTTGKHKLVINVNMTPQEVDEVVGELKQRNLKVPSIWCGRFALDTTDELKRLIDYSAACECPSILLGGTNEKTETAYYKVIADCCDYAAEKKVIMCVKPHGGSNASGAQCRRHIDKINHPNFKLWFDPGNVYFYSNGELSPVEDAAAVDGLVAGMCIKDFKPPKDVNMTPGTGIVDFRATLARLKQGGFTSGALVVECLTDGDLPHLAAEALKARTFTTSLLV